MANSDDGLGRAPVCPSKRKIFRARCSARPRRCRTPTPRRSTAPRSTYDGDEERAHRTAWASVKHIAEKKGDHWELKDEKGPSDPQAARGGKAARDNPRETAGGVNANKTKAELEEDAREADIPGRSKMNKDELVDALKRHNDRGDG